MSVSKPIRVAAVLSLVLAVQASAFADPFGSLFGGGSSSRGHGQFGRSPRMTHSGSFGQFGRGEGSSSSSSGRRPNGIDIATGVLGIIENATRPRPTMRPDWGYRPSYPSYRPQPSYTPTYQPSRPVITNTYRPPAVSKPVVQTPRNNTKPTRKETPKENKPPGSGGGFGLVPENAAGDAADDLDEQVEDGIEESQQEQDEKIDKRVEKIADGANPAQKEALEDAVADGDVDKAKQIATAMGADPREIDRLARDMVTDGHLDRIADAVDDGASAGEIEELTDALHEHLDAPTGTLNGGRDDKKLMRDMEDWVTSLGARDTLDEVAAGGGGLGFPSGTTDIVTVPGLPPGTIAVTPDGQVIQGVGPDGVLSVTEGTAADLLGIAVPAGEPVEDTTNDSIAVSGTVLRNPDKNLDPVHYTVNGKRFEMQPGFVQKLQSGRNVVAFHRGAQYGTARYRLADGTYEFTVTDRGWELFKKTYKVALDNSGNENEFHYVLNGERQTLAAGGRQTVASDYPLLMTFDRGDGTTTNKQLDGGTYQVGLDMKNDRLELFHKEG